MKKKGRARNSSGQRPYLVDSSAGPLLPNGISNASNAAKDNVIRALYLSARSMHTYTCAVLYYIAYRYAI